MASVLVAYASKYGSTREVAEAVAARLRERGARVELLAAGEVPALDVYDAVVFGGALYFFSLIGEGKRFFRRHHKALANVPLAVFGMGPIEDEAEQFTGAREHLDKTLSKYADVSPVDVVVFGGAVDPTVLRFPDNNPAFKSMGARDLRDWTAIEAWADSLPQALGI